MTRGQAEGDAPPPVLDRAAILAARDDRTELVDVPEWGGRVRMRGFTGTERDGWEADIIAAERKGLVPRDIRVRRVAMCLVDEDGKRLFGDRDMAELGRKNGVVIDRLDDVVLRLSGMRAARPATDATPAVPSSEDEALADLGKGESDGSGSA